MMILSCIPLKRPKSGGTVPIFVYIHCPAVLQSTPLVLNLFAIAASVFLPRAAARAYEMTGHTCTFLLPCVHEQWRFTIFYMATHAGKEVPYSYISVAERYTAAYTYTVISCCPSPPSCTQSCKREKLICCRVIQLQFHLATSHCCRELAGEASLERVSCCRLASTR